MKDANVALSQLYLYADRIAPRQRDLDGVHAGIELEPLGFRGRDTASIDRDAGAIGGAHMKLGWRGEGVCRVEEVRQTNAKEHACHQDDHRDERPQAQKQDGR